MQGSNSCHQGQDMAKQTNLRHASSKLTPYTHPNETNGENMVRNASKSNLYVVAWYSD